MKTWKNKKESNIQNENNIQNIKENNNLKGERVLVYVRIRPFNNDELEKDNSSPIEVIDTKNNAMICN